MKEALDVHQEKKIKREDDKVESEENIFYKMKKVRLKFKRC